MVAPKPAADADGTWFGQVFPRGKYVYPDHARLWLTARTLQDAGEIESPGGMRSLVDAVYGDGVYDSTPDGLAGSLWDAEGRAGAERGVATANVLDFTRGHVRDAGAWDRDVRTPTRLHDNPQMTLRLARVTDGRIKPHARDPVPDEPWRAWRLSEVSVSARRIGGEAVPPEHAETARTAKKEWTRYDSDKLLVVLEPADAGEQVLVGAALSADDAAPTHVRIRYEQARGLEVLADGHSADSFP